MRAASIGTADRFAFRAIDGNTYFDQQDYLGTERMRTDYTGMVAAVCTSFPWGDGYAANVAEPERRSGPVALRRTGSGRRHRARTVP